MGANLRELQAAISAYKEMLTSKPDFLNERFVSQEEADQLDQVVVLPETIPLRPPDKVPDAEEIRQMAEKYGLPVRLMKSIPTRSSSESYLLLVTRSRTN
ncbi:hypothetical protein AAVH_31667 [Aphelenchoides avenae]|nr:hypothetical protein AAVH_31667 [Aphelenchus avenae]